jgi:hypothetical protein
MLPGLPAACDAGSRVSAGEFFVGEVESFIEIPSETLPVSVGMELCALAIATQERRAAINRTGHRQFVFEKRPILAIDVARAATHPPSISGAESGLRPTNDAYFGYRLFGN